MTFASSSEKEWTQCRSPSLGPLWGAASNQALSKAPATHDLTSLFLTHIYFCCVRFLLCTEKFFLFILFIGNISYKCVA